MLNRLLAILRFFELVAAWRESVGKDMALMVDVACCLSDWKEAMSVCRSLEK